MEGMGSGAGSHTADTPLAFSLLLAAVSCLLCDVAAAAAALLLWLLAVHGLSEGPDARRPLGSTFELDRFRGHRSPFSKHLTCLEHGEPVL